MFDIKKKNLEVIHGFLKKYAFIGTENITSCNDIAWSNNQRIPDSSPKIGLPFVDEIHMQRKETKINNFIIR